MTAEERIVIVGGGGFGREVICWAADCQAAGRLPLAAGFLDDDATLDLSAYGIPHLGPVGRYAPQAQDRFLLAVGNPSTKRRIVHLLQAQGARFATLIHPTAIVARTAVIEEGVIMCPYSLIAADARVGRFATINCYSSGGHDSRIGEFATLSAHVDVTGYANIGPDALIGSGATILPRVRIGMGATVGAGSVVYRSVPPDATVFAPPAKRLKK